MKYFIYCRKSTDSEDRQVLSLESQEKELLSLAKSLNLEIVDTFHESKSAKEPGRPVFNEMIKKITSNKADGILCWKIDRLTRNPVDGGQIQWLLQNNKIKSIQTIDKNYLPNDNVLIMSIEQAMANQYIRDLSTNVKRGNRAKLEKGEWPNHAPLGYLNDKATKTIKVDKKMAPYIVRAAELYATGGNTLKDIADILHKEGLRNKSGNKIHKNQIHRFITNKFYRGLMERDGKIYNGNHKAIISQSLYNKIQEVLENKNHPHAKKHFYPAKGFLKCGSCNCAITVDSQKGYKYYFCTNGKGNCDEHKKYMRSEYVDSLISDMFFKLHINEEFIDMCAEAYKQKNQDKVNYKQSSLDTLSNELNMLQDKELALVDGYTSKLIRDEVYKLKIKEIEIKRSEILQQIKEINSKRGVPTVTLEQIKNVFIDGNISSKKYLEVGEREKKNMLEKLLSNAFIKDRNIVNFQFKSPYDTLVKIPKNASFSEMLGDRDSNPN